MSATCPLVFVDVLEQADPLPATWASCPRLTRDLLCWSVRAVRLTLSAVDLVDVLGLVATTSVPSALGLHRCGCGVALSDAERVRSCSAGEMAVSGRR